ncbi:MAG: mitochondrial ribosomal small subunit component [Bogoriella megaspora]|nr:MAG: mitochondrial ribosomal small subunit component [Bogoriella megaspora]
MGQFDFAAQRVHQAATQLLASQRIKNPPSWYQILSDVPPPQRLVRPAIRPDRLANLSASAPVSSQKLRRKHLRKWARKPKRPSRMFQPLNLDYPDDDLRKEFFSDHPWELAKPRVVLENDGRDAQKWDWSLGIQQPGKPTDGESVVQRQNYYSQLRPPYTFASDLSKDQADRTVIVKNVRKGTTVENLQAFFSDCDGMESLPILHNDLNSTMPLHQVVSHVVTMEPGTTSTILKQVSPDEDTASKKEPEETPTIMASIRFKTVSQAFAAIQKSGQSFDVQDPNSPDPQSPELHISRCLPPPHSVFVYNVPAHVTPSHLLEAFTHKDIAKYGAILHVHLFNTRSSPHRSAGHAIVTFSTPGAALEAKRSYIHHSHVQVYDFPLSHAQAYDLARKEFYDVRFRQDIERRVAAEEAQSTGGWSGPGPNEIAMKLEDLKFDDWREWAAKEVQRTKQQEGSLITSLDDEEVVPSHGELEAGIEEAGGVVGKERNAFGGAAVTA